MRFKLPKIQNLLNSNKKVLDNDSRKLIHVFNGYAVVSNDIIVVVDIKEYVKRELKITVEEDLNTLKTIVSWMNGKSFNREFWTEFTKEISVVNVDDENEMEIEFSGFTKKLLYEKIETDSMKAFSLLKSSIKAEKTEMERFSINGEILSLISKAFGTEIKSDEVIFQLSGSGKGIKFSFSTKDYIFGIVPESFNASMSMIAFDNFNTISEILENSPVPDIEEDFSDEDLWNSDENED